MVRLMRPESRRRRAGRLVCALSAMVAMAFMAACAPTTSGATPIALSPAGTLYHGVYPGGQNGQEDDVTPADLEDYEQAVGQGAAWVVFSHNWYRSPQFPLATATWIRELGKVLYIRLMLRSAPDNPTPDPEYSIDAILAGHFDDEVQAWGAAAAEFGSPLIVEWGTEMNGSWFAWNATWNGAEMGADAFRDAYRHIIDVVDRAGADNITWVFHLNSSDDPEEPWNAFERYYPGDDDIDWIGVSAYGAQSPTDTECVSLVEQLDEVMPRIRALTDLPVVVSEFGSAAGNPTCDQAAWADAALAALLANRWPEVHGFSWWDEDWQNDDDPSHDTSMNVADSEELTDVFRARLSGSIWSTPVVGE